MLKAINIIAFDVPFPANYGGVIDVFYKLKYFHQQGIKVHLHCFEYGRGEQPELTNYCESVTYYKRHKGLFSLLSHLPYIVKSRVSKGLKKNLLQNDFPILFEGLHTCYLLDDVAFKNRLKVVRCHNVEHNYYEELASAEKNFLKRIYYQSEAKKLKAFETILSHANYCLAISSADKHYFHEHYRSVSIKNIPAFHGNDAVNVKHGKGEYVLYHGNLSVAENSNASEFMVSQIFSELKIPFIIAGLNPSLHLKHLVAKYDHITLLANPTNIKLQKLIADAQVNFLYTDQATGLKLKLLNVLFKGRFCVVNSKMVAGTSLAKVCIVKDKVTDLKIAIEATFKQEINNSIIEHRKELLSPYANAESFKEMLKCFS